MREGVDLFGELRDLFKTAASFEDLPARIGTDAWSQNSYS